MHVLKWILERLFKIADSVQRKELGCCNFCKVIDGMVSEATKEFPKPLRQVHPIEDRSKNPQSEVNISC